MTEKVLGSYIDIKLTESSSIAEAVKYLAFHSIPKMAEDYRHRVMSECPDFNKDETQYSFSTPKGVPCSDCLYMEELYNKYQEELAQHTIATNIIKRLSQYL